MWSRIWSEKVEEQFISMIEERPALYHHEEKSYTNRKAKADLWHQIECKLQISEKELKKRWDTLRTMYARFHKHPISGSVELCRTTRQQWILSRLQFLEPHTKPRQSRSTLNQQESPVADQGSSCSSEASLSSEEEDSSPSGAPEASPPAEHKAESTHRGLGLRRAVTKRRKTEDQTSAVVSNLIMSTAQALDRMSQEKEDDTLDFYFKYVKSTVRDFPEHLQNEFIHDLDNLLYKYKRNLLKADSGNHVSLL